MIKKLVHFLQRFSYVASLYQGIEHPKILDHVEKNNHQQFDLISFLKAFQSLSGLNNF